MPNKKEKNSHDDAPSMFLKYADLVQELFSMHVVHGVMNVTRPWFN